MLGPPEPDDDDATASASPPHHGPDPTPRELVLACAGLLHRGDLAAARRLADQALSAADPRGEASDRLAHHFARALALRAPDNGGDSPSPAPVASTSSSSSSSVSSAAAAAAYLAYNKIAPFLRFAHLTANQAILEAFFSSHADRPQHHSRVLHIVDLDAAHGVQWPPLLQALRDRAADDPPVEVRVTGAGPDRDALLRTGNRLRAFAASIDLPFRFHPLLLPCPGAASAGLELELHPDEETLAVNCVFFLHRLSNDGELATFLRWVNSMNPAVLTIAEREGSSEPADELPRRVAAAMDLYYAAVFDALEATVPPGSAERMAVEEEILGREIDAVVAGGSGSRTRGFEAWAAAARGAGLSPRPASAFAAAQARLLLRLHYPSEGYAAEEAHGACFLGWQRRPLMSVSSWQ
ncbi:protein MONOCULM 1 [Brachypodium distachyon]|uniref:Uncharacterized protein n=1 Tax=Brachypodium distachyon TaxID=15368 RepID=I1HYD1_BRADI|nr:protein MONOCULM 1 [Brachypodium distachyon]KQJ93867.1 hypothetical protein BRADI_3g07160v3 [Brachypodium distachyon]|eukprot:XP_003571074.1 protein MONOCULM 1 [Brachypodium distachyon]